MDTIHRIIGQIKWFNNKAGYGFITKTNEGGKCTDIFVHYTAIRVTNSQYKYLVQGEYVEFEIIKSEKGAHEFQAMNVSGIDGGQLICETQRRLMYDAGHSLDRRYRLPNQGTLNRTKPLTRPPSPLTPPDFSIN